MHKGNRNASYLRNYTELVSEAFESSNFFLHSASSKKTIIITNNQYEMTWLSISSNEPEYSFIPLQDQIFVCEIIIINEPTIQYYSTITSFPYYLVVPESNSQTNYYPDGSHKSFKRELLDILFLGIQDNFEWIQYFLLYCLDLTQLILPFFPTLYSHPILLLIQILLLIFKYIRHLDR